MAIIVQQMAITAIQPPELWRKPKLIASQHQVRTPVSIEVPAIDRVHTRQLNHYRQRRYPKPSLAIIDRYNGWTIVELFDRRLFHHLLAKQVPYRFGCIVAVLQVLLLQRRKL